MPSEASFGQTESTIAEPQRSSPIRAQPEGRARIWRRLGGASYAERFAGGLLEFGDLRYWTAVLARCFVSGMLSLLLVGCGASAVPELRPDDLHRSTLPGVTPRTVRLVVIEHRDPTPEETEETMVRIREALAGSLKRAEVAVSQESPNEFSVTVAYPENPPDGFSREACIQMTGRLSQTGRGFAKVSAIRCFEWRHLLGFSLGGDSSKTFQAATNDMLDQLDRQLAMLPPPVAK